MNYNKTLLTSRFVKCRQCQVWNIPDVIYFGQDKNNITETTSN